MAQKSLQYIGQTFEQHGRFVSLIISVLIHISLLWTVTHLFGSLNIGIAEAPRINFTFENTSIIFDNNLRKSIQRSLQTSSMTQSLKSKNKKKLKQALNEKTTSKSLSAQPSKTVPKKIGKSLTKGMIQNNDFQAYLNSIREKIESHQFYPARARGLLMDGRAYVRFTVLRNGSIKDVKIDQSSENSLIDNAAVKTVKNASPFSPFPTILDLPDELTLRQPLDYHVNVNKNRKNK